MRTNSTSSRPSSSRLSSHSSGSQNGSSFKSRPDDDSGRATGMRSCFVIPSFGKKNRRGIKGGPVISSAASTDQSSTADNIFNPMANNDHQLLLQKSNQLTTNWFDDDFAWSSDTSSQKPEQQRSALVSPESQPPSSLLLFPTPQDRSHQARRKNSERKGVMYAYDGELEPEGVRGQEAKVVKPQPEAALPIPIRTFHPMTGEPTSTPQITMSTMPVGENRGRPIFEFGDVDGISDVDNASTTSSQDIQSLMQSEFSDPKGQYLRSGSLLVRSGSSSLLESDKPQQKEQEHRHQQKVISQLRQIQQTSYPATISEKQEGTYTEVTSRRERLPQHESAPPPQQSRAPQPQVKFADQAHPQRQTRKQQHPQQQHPQQQQQQQQPQPRSQAPQYIPQFLPYEEIQPQHSLGAQSPHDPYSGYAQSNSSSRSNSNKVDESFGSGSIPDISSHGSQEFKVPNFRKSAPVNIDDSSFEDPLQNVQGIHAMAMEHVMRGEYDMALQAFSQVLTVYLEKYGRAHPLTASAYHNLGTVHSKRAGLLLDHTLHQRHCREQALLCFQAAARSARDSPQLGPSHPNVAVSLVRIGFLLLQSRQYQNAVITFQEALRIRKEHYGPTHALVANLYNNLGVCHMHLQEFVVGRRYLQQALDNQKELLAQDEFSTTALLELADTLCNIGGLCLEWIRQQGPDARHALDAESAFLEALEVRAKVLGENHALTNQVRSLHDMVRSIPIPKMSPRGSQSSVVHPSPSRSTRSRSPIGISPLSNPPSGRPYATSSTPTVSPSHSVSSSTRGSKTPDALSLPALDGQPTTRQIQRRKEDPPPTNENLTQRSPSPEETVNSNSRIAPLDSSALSELGSTFTSMLSRADLRTHDASEENCLLGPKQEDGQVTVVSYTQSTASWASSTRKETERLAYVMQAKAILDANRAYLDSPQLTLHNRSRPSNNNNNKSIDTKYVQDKPETLEDGLVPLGGDWPEPTEDRITPKVLEDPHQHLITIHDSAVNRFKQGKYGEAVHLLEIVADTQREKNGPVHKDVGDALHNVGIVQLRLGENYKALQAFEESVRVRKGAFGRDHPLVAVSLVKVGITLMLLKRLEDALWIFREALTVRKHALGPLHPSSARIYNNIGCVHVELNEPKEAKRAFEAAIDIQRNAMVNEPKSGPILFGAATTLQNLAYLYKKLQMFDKEMLVLKESFSIQEKVLGTNHPSVLVTLDNLAQACGSCKKEDQALKYYNEYLERLHETGEDTWEKQASILVKMSRIHKQMKDIEAQLNKLHIASKLLRMDTLTETGQDLEHEIQSEMRQARRECDELGLDWV